MIKIEKMYQTINIELEKKMDQTYHYLADNLKKITHNNKPILMRSIIVSTLLYNLNYSDNIVISAILHDLIEDTNIDYSDIKENFGKDITDIVITVSFNSDIEGKIEQTDEMFERIVKLRYDAKIVKCADLYSNIPFIKLVNQKEIRKYLIYKYTEFIRLFGNDLSNEAIYKRYLNRYNKLINKLNKHST